VKIALFSLHTRSYKNI